MEQGGGAAVSILLFDALKPLPRGFAVSCCSVRSLLQDPALSPAEPDAGAAPWERRGVSFGNLGRREKCSCWRGFVLCPMFVQIQKGGTTTN